MPSSRWGTEPSTRERPGEAGAFVRLALVLAYVWDYLSKLELQLARLQDARLQLALVGSIWPSSCEQLCFAAAISASSCASSSAGMSEVDIPSAVQLARLHEARLHEARLHEARLQLARSNSEQDSGVALQEARLHEARVQEARVQAGPRAGAEGGRA